MIDPEIDQDRKDISAKYIDRYYITLDKAEDLDREYDEIVEYEYKDDSKLWKKILFPLDFIESYKYSEYTAVFGEPPFGFLVKHPSIFRVNLIPKYNYIAIPPKINCGFVWSTSDFPCQQPQIEKIRLEPLMAIFRETEKVTFLKTQKVISTEKVGNVLIKRTRYKKVTDLDKLFFIINREFRFLKFRLTAIGFTRLFSGDKVELDNKDYVILL